MQDLNNRITAQVSGMMAASKDEIRKCERHGISYQAREHHGIWSRCPKCMDEYLAEKAKRESEEQQAENRQRMADAFMKRAAIPPRFADRRLETYEAHNEGAAKALRIASDYADNFGDRLKTGTSLIFCGGVGSGKTHLAVGIAHRVMATGHFALFTSVMSAVRSVKETYSKGSEVREAAAIGNLVEPDLLILDEVGVQFGSEAEKLILFEIINGRYEAMRPTIAISNLAMPELSKFLGDRVIDRFREGGGRMVTFDWPSYRREQK